MKTISRHLLISLAALSVALLSGCQAAATPPPVDTATDTPTRTILPTLTDTPTITPTNTEAFTATPTLTNTPPYNLPGLYKFNKCVTYQPAGIPEEILVIFCVQSVKVYDNLNMQFNVTWRTNIELGSSLTKRSDVNNNNMFITDNLGNAYYAIDWGGGAAEKASVSKSPIGGWFLFPPAKAGATSFIFNDADNIVSIDGIILSRENNISPPTATPTYDPATVFNGPGTYAISKCANYPAYGLYPGVSKIELCLLTVVIDENYEMKFNMKWTITLDTRVDPVKKSDADNHNIILLDDMANEYHHIKTGGCAAEDTNIGWATSEGNDADCNGWFQFPPAKPGAFSFRFVYDTLVSFENIILAKKP